MILSLGKGMYCETLLLTYFLFHPTWLLRQTSLRSLQPEKPISRPSMSENIQTIQRGRIDENKAHGEAWGGRGKLLDA